MFTGVSAFQMGLMGLIHIIAAMIGAGMFERYPRLGVSFGDSGAETMMWGSEFCTPKGCGLDYSKYLQRRSAVISLLC